MGCGASGGMKSVANSITGFASTLANEAQNIYGDASQVFGNLWGKIQSIVNGGPGQWGFPTGQTQAMQAANAQAAATMGRNLQAAAATSGAALGGGNVAQPAGATIAATDAARQAAAAQQAQGENAIIQAGYQQGNQNFWAATQAGEQLPNVFNASTAANKNVTSQQTEAMNAQTAMNTANNWWQPMLGSVLSSVAGSVTGGLLKNIGGNSSSAPVAQGTVSPNMTPSYMPTPSLGSYGPDLAAPEGEGGVGTVPGLGPSATPNI
jgi:hypothetical protein